MNVRTNNLVGCVYVCWGKTTIARTWFRRKSKYSLTHRLNERIGTNEVFVSRQYSQLFVNRILWLAHSWKAGWYAAHAAWHCITLIKFWCACHTHNICRHVCLCIGSGVQTVLWKIHFSNSSCVEAKKFQNKWKIYWIMCVCASVSGFTSGNSIHRGVELNTNNSIRQKIEIQFYFRATHTQTNENMMRTKNANSKT